jgi:hypothetical protein
MKKEDAKLIIAVDFDGTIVTHKYPQIGNPAPLAIEILKRLQEAGHKIILWTMRSGDKLDEAVAYLKENGIEPWGINMNPDQAKWTSSNKAYAQVYIDDAAFGCPCFFDAESQRQVVNWAAIEKAFVDSYIIMPSLRGKKTTNE